MDEISIIFFIYLNRKLVGNNLEITHRTYVTDQKKSSIKAVHYWEVRIIIFSGFLYGSSFLTLFHFNPSYYFDLVLYPKFIGN